MNNTDLLAKARQLPREPGCYIMKDEAGEEIYIGKAKDLRRRVSSYFQPRNRPPKDIALIQNITDFEQIVTESEIEAVLLESRMIKDLRPKYNFMLKNNELYPYIEVTMGEDFPRVLVTRRQRPGQSRYFGPFSSASELRVVLGILGKIFRFRVCNLKIKEVDQKRRFTRPCLNFHIGRCLAPCSTRVTKEVYRKQITKLLLFFGGKKKDLIKEIHQEMEAAAKALHFEDASILRDSVTALENINNAPSLDSDLAPMVPIIDPRKGLESLRDALGLSFTPRRIEGIDIANLQGKEMVGAVVTFLDALPFKDGYRRYRIKTVEGQDDFACINEVVRRRYLRLLQEGRELPEIILIDGGKGQLSSAKKALEEIGAYPESKDLGAAGENSKATRIPILMSLAKEEETPFLASTMIPAPLSRRAAGLKLLMYVRDEAHRFAQHYHHILRKKATFG